MHYRTVGDLSELVNAYAHRVPHDVDLIVGIPRSGMLVASILSLKLNLPMTDLYAFHRNDVLDESALRRCRGRHLERPWDAKRVLLVDDSIASGKSLREAVEMAREVFPGEIMTMVAFAQRDNTSQVDVFLETVEQPRLFEWNIMHHNLLAFSCVNLDGVIAEARSAKSSQEALQPLWIDRPPLFVPSARIGHLITATPEAAREQVEAWLKRHGVCYEKLHMPPAPLTGEDQGELMAAYRDFVAGVFKNDPHALMLFESCPGRAEAVMQATQKSVFCVTTNEMHNPGLSWSALLAPAVRKTLRFRDKALVRMRGLIGAHPTA
ncbi:phosphoribosyltransferase [Pseudomonas sp.]|jgi:adenine/guanine phosphoribosyltransferase-like PRPP-binding protein|uniref:phosphoribosyltransferase n=1 Tax=Pseudomonas sp. TaxID=306 RepID=UPI00272C2F33|nr:phosphoribosyltransferase [Pseudomonas sp.]